MVFRHASTNFTYIPQYLIFDLGSDWMTLQDICKAKAQALGVTYPQISSEAGVPLQTVRNFFSSASKAPSVNTAGPICKFLGVSIDAYCGIGDRLTPTEETLSAKNDTLRAHREELQQRVDSKDKTIDMMWHGVRLRNHVICVLLGIVVLLLLWCIYIDIHCADYGFWRG